MIHKRVLSLQRNLDEIFRDNMLEPKSSFTTFCTLFRNKPEFEKKVKLVFCKVAEYGFSMNPVSKRNSNDLDEVKSLYVS